MPRVWGGDHQTSTYRPHVRPVVQCPACGLEHKQIPRQCQDAIAAAVVSLSDRHRHRPTGRKGGRRA